MVHVLLGLLVLEAHLVVLLVLLDLHLGAGLGLGDSHLVLGLGLGNLHLVGSLLLVHCHVVLSLFGLDAGLQLRFLAHDLDLGGGLLPHQLDVSFHFPHLEGDVHFKFLPPHLHVPLLLLLCKLGVLLGSLRLDLCIELRLLEFRRRRSRLLRRFLELLLGLRGKPGRGVHEHLYRNSRLSGRKHRSDRRENLGEGIEDVLLHRYCVGTFVQYDIHVETANGVDNSR